jgi:hypothetical protein
MAFSDDGMPTQPTVTGKQTFEGEKSEGLHGMYFGDRGLEGSTKRSARA